MDLNFGEEVSARPSIVVKTLEDLEALVFVECGFKPGGFALEGGDRRESGLSGHGGWLNNVNVVGSVMEGYL